MRARTRRGSMFNISVIRDLRELAARKHISTLKQKKGFLIFLLPSLLFVYDCTKYMSINFISYCKS